MNKVTMVVIRIKPDGTLGLSKPCHHCTIKLKEYGVGKVYYSNENGFLVKEKPSNMENSYVTLGNRKLNVKANRK